MPDRNGKPTPGPTALLPDEPHVVDHDTPLAATTSSPADESETITLAAPQPAPPPPPPPARRMTLDAPGPRPVSPRGHLVGRLVAGVAVGVILGGVIGGVVSAGQASGATASALVEIAAPADPGLLAADGGGGQSPDSLAGFAANEFASLTSDAFKDQVAKKVGDPLAPLVTVTRIGQSTVANFTAQGTTDEVGIQVVQAAVDLYTDRRTAAYRGYLKDSIASIDKTLEEIQPRGDAPQADPSLQARIDRVLVARGDLQLLMNRDTVPVRVVEPAAVSSRPGSSPSQLGAVLGALMGGLLTVGLIMFKRFRSTTIVDAAGVESIVGQVLHPVVALPGGWETTSLRVLRAPDRYAAQLLSSQVAGPEPVIGRTIGVVASSTESGSRAVATFLSVGGAVLGPTLLVEFTGRPHPLGPDVTPQRIAKTEVDELSLVQINEAHPSDSSAWRPLMDTIRSGSHLVVVDVGTHPELLRKLPGPIETVLVVGLGIDDARHVAALATSLPTSRTPTVGVLTRVPWYRTLPGLRRRRTHG